MSPPADVSLAYEGALDVAFGAAYLLVLAALARRTWQRRHAPRAGWLLAIAVTWAGCGVAEALLRASGVRRPAGLALVGAPLDGELGWRGSFVEGDAASRQPRLLVAGDSFTDAGGVPAEARYPAVLARELGMEPWAYSAPGWGTLQERLALERAFDRVRPDLLVLQVCSNDFINNDWELERGSYANNNLSRRPYWERGRVAWRDPAALLPVRRFLAARSALATWASGRLRHAGVRLETSRLVSSTEQRVGRAGRAWPPFDRAVRTTEELVELIAARAGAGRLVLLPADSAEPYLAEWRGIAQRRGLPFLSAALERVDAARRRGEAVHSDGVHWTAAGHREVALALVAWRRGHGHSGRTASPAHGT